MIKITAFDVYEAAIEYAVWNDREITIDYIEKYKVTKLFFIMK